MKDFKIPVSGGFCRSWKIIYMWEKKTITPENTEIFKTLSSSVLMSFFFQSLYCKMNSNTLISTMDKPNLAMNNFEPQDFNLHKLKTLLQFIVDTLLVNGFYFHYMYILKWPVKQIAFCWDVWNINTHFFKTT